MELRHFRLMKTVVEEGSMTKAARTLYLSQSALSHQLRELEEEVGVPLFHRIKKRLVLTDAGRRVLNSAETIISEVDRVSTELKRVAAGDGGELRFASCCFTCYHYLPSLIKTFRRSFPDVKIVLNGAATADPLGFLRKGEIDVALTTARHHDPYLEYAKLRDDELLAVIPANHPWRSKDFVTARDFAEQDLVSYDIPDDEISFFRKVLIPADVKPKSVTKLPAIDSMIQLVASGLAVAVIDEWSLERFRDNRDLATVHLGSKGLWQTWYAATLKTAKQPIYIKAFVDFLRRKSDG